MRKKILQFLPQGISLVLIACLGYACGSLNQVASEVKRISDELQVGTAPTNSEIIGGLKEALQVGTKNAVGSLSRAGGFLNNGQFKIPFPSEAQKAADRLRSMGFNKLVDDFEVSMNRAAERAVVQAKPIFVKAIQGMTFADARQILTGGNGAATRYFKDNTATQLRAAFRPEIQKALNGVNATKYWKDITSRYNQIPLVQKVNTDLTGYVTDRALDALFQVVESEENKIRSNPAARVSDLLKKVFGSV